VDLDDDACKRDRLVTTLLEQFGLLDVAAEACRRSAIEGREQQVAYCLIVLSAKADHIRSSSLRPAGRTYGLDVGAGDFAERLATWAGTIAGNLRDWAATYEAIQDEFDRYEITTLRQLVRVSTGDDVIDAIADKLGAVLANGQRLEDMTVELARETISSGAEYVFQSPLSRWVMTGASRVVPWDTDPLGPREEEIQGSDGWTDVLDEIALRSELDLDVYRELVDRVAGLADTRSLLPPTIRRGEQLDREATRSRLATAADVRLFARLRAELAHVGDELRREQRAFGEMLAYIVLAMRCAQAMQGVAILSLRIASLERAVIDEIAERMRAIIGDDHQPTPSLISRARKAADAGVPKTRAAALERLRDTPGSRAAELAPVARLLDALPSTVGDVAAIGSALLPTAISAGNAATTRGHAVKELTAVDVWFGRVFRRYAMGRP
jgi:hypothetical protein